MEAVLYICHGTRIRDGQIGALQFIERCKEKVNVPIQEACFLELAEPTIEEAFARCIKQGATKIVAVPILLLTAGHAKKDIPEILLSLAEAHPEIEVVYGTPFGVHDKLVDVLMDRIREANSMIDKDATVLLVGRGSSDPDVKRDLNEIALMLERRGGFLKVDICFLTAAEPTFEQGLRGLTGNKQVYIVPYILFTGLLMRQIAADVSQLLVDSSNIFLCSFLGYHTILEDILAERIEKWKTQKGNLMFNGEGLCTLSH